MTKQNEAGKELAVVQHGLAVPQCPPVAALPTALDGLVDVPGWFKSLVTGDDYTEPVDGFMQRKILFGTARAASIADVFKPLVRGGLQDFIPNQPGATTGPVEIDELYIMPSKKAAGHPTFMLFTMESLKTHQRMTKTTGAGNLQMQFLLLIAYGFWPIRCEITRLDVADKGGKYIFHAFPVE